MKTTSSHFGDRLPGSDESLGFSFNDLTRVPGVSAIPGVGDAIGILRTIQSGQSLFNSISSMVGADNPCQRKNAAGSIVTKALGSVLSMTGIPMGVFNAIGFSSMFRCKPGRRNISNKLSEYYNRMAGGAIDAYIGLSINSEIGYANSYSFDPPQLGRFDGENAVEVRREFAARVIDFISVGNSVSDSMVLAKTVKYIDDNSFDEYMDLAEEESMSLTDYTKDENYFKFNDQIAARLLQLSDSYDQISENEKTILRESSRRVGRYYALNKSLRRSFPATSGVYQTPATFMTDLWFKAFTKQALIALDPASFEKYAKEDFKNLYSHEDMIDFQILHNTKLQDEYDDLTDVEIDDIKKSKLPLIFALASGTVLTGSLLKKGERQ